MASSALFQPYRALGFVCDSNPFHLKKLGNNPAQHFITVHTSTFLIISHSLGVLFVYKVLHTKGSKLFNFALSN
jgi:hypothetical protein